MRSIELKNQTEKPRYCKSCFKEIHTSQLRSFLEEDIIICDECLKQINIRLRYEKIRNIWILFLSTYDNIYKRWLIDYKERFDFELSKLFLIPFKHIVKIYSFNKSIVCCPSSILKIKERGFNHLEEILKSASLKYYSLLQNDSIAIQKEKGIIERREKRSFSIDRSIKVDKDKTIILFDDIMTTGSTFFQSVDALNKAGFKKIRGLILMDNRFTDKRRLK